MEAKGTRKLFVSSLDLHAFGRAFVAPWKRAQYVLKPNAEDKLLSDGSGNEFIEIET